MSVNVPASVSLNLAGPARSYRRSSSRSYGRRRSYGRSYSRGGRSSYYQKRAVARKAYVRGKWPSSEWAHPYVRRGSAAAQALGLTPGQSYQEANAENQALRKSVGWYGKGSYAGNGGYIGSVLGGLIGGAAGLTTMAGISRASPLAPMKLDIAHGMYRAGAAAGSEAEDWLRNCTFHFQCLFSN
jgi:hypothetical protein